MKNNYGNFVVQKALLLADNDLKEAFFKRINDSMITMTNKKLKTKWNQIIEFFSKSNTKDPLKPNPLLHNLREDIEEGEDYINENMN